MEWWHEDRAVRQRDLTTPFAFMPLGFAVPEYPCRCSAASAFRDCNNIPCNVQEHTGCRFAIIDKS